MIFSRFKWNKNSVLELTEATHAYIYYRNTRMNLLTGFPEAYPFNMFLKRLDAMKIQDKVKNPIVFHFYYELGLVLAGLGHFVKDDAPLAIELEYKNKSFKKNPTSKLASLPLKDLERPNWTEYKKAFSFIQENLLSGNCYQVNLTYPFDFYTKDLLDPRDISDFFFSRKGLSGYAHLTFLGDDMILSNSPECLFHYKNNKLSTMPIKGTMKRGKDWKKDWKEMLKSHKEEGELNMITDLLRNDLNRLEKPIAIVQEKRVPLLVPGLVHQCSVLSVKLEEDLSIKKTLESLFPGGSITGAPKKRVMEIIQNVELCARGIYCGSTMLCIGDKKIANINIRTFSLSISERIWRYGAGGGITLLSKAPNEFQEMESKVASFLTLLRAPSYKPTK